MSVKIKDVVNNSIADKNGILKNDELISINKNEINDALDYNFYTKDSKLKLLIKRNNRNINIKIKKDEFEDLGLEFETYLMDSEHHCKNKCIFCFIDQMPKGMSDTLYFKDDDSRLSFLFGNYITLTNISRHEIDRIKKMHISPINISVHTTNPELRVFMMKNKNAGKALDVLYELAEFGKKHKNSIKINCQLVLCPGINDGEELKSSLTDLIDLYPVVQSVAVVPVGITKFRQNLFELESYNEKTANKVIEIVEKFADDCKTKLGERIVFASDEFYIIANKKLPDYDYYEDFAQLDNGVGICKMLEYEFLSALEEFAADDNTRKLSVATGKAFYPMMTQLVDKAKEKWHNLDCNVYAIENDFFGHKITVTGLITGRDLINQLKNKPLGEKLLISSSCFKSQSDLMLDDVTVADIENELNVKVQITENDGYILLNNMLN